MINIVDSVHNINLQSMGSFNDFEPGLSPEGSKSLNFLQDDTIYVFVDAVANFHHFLVCVLMPSLEIINSIDNKKLHFVLSLKHQKQNADNFDNLLIELLQEKRINYTAIQAQSDEYANAKNFIAVNGPDIAIGIPMLYDYFVEKYKTSQLATNKKIYISRKKFQSQEKRVDDELVLEKLFEENGFQIVYAEEIKTFKEQFELFNSCSVLAGLSGTGLTNLLLMPKNQVVIEIVTRLEIGVNDTSTGESYIEGQIHEHYKDFCIYKDHVVINIFNMEKSSQNIKEKFNAAMKSLNLSSS
jgi:capsular polysaccharide biosynthesis protein